MRKQLHGFISRKTKTEIIKKRLKSDFSLFLFITNSKLFLEDEAVHQKEVPSLNMPSQRFEYSVTTLLSWKCIA